MENKLKNKGLSGLSNVGNSCYINTCMQLISHTHELNTLLNNLDLSKVNNNLDGVFLKEWNDLRKMLWSSECTIAPNRFINIIQKISKDKNILEFSGFMQNDLQEFLIFVIDTLHNGIKREVDMNINGISKNDIDKLAIESEESYKNLMDLGMNVDSRYSGRIFEVAGNFLRNAIDAKGSKIDKKLKMVELQLKKMKLDQGNKDGPAIEESDGFVISDRNELMKKLLKKG